MRLRLRGQPVDNQFHNRGSIALTLEVLEKKCNARRRKSRYEARDLRDPWKKKRSAARKNEKRWNLGNAGGQNEAGEKAANRP